MKITTKQSIPFTQILTFCVYRVCHRFRLQSKMIIFASNMTTFKLSVVFQAAGAVVKIGSSLKPNHHKEI
jgi:hypothetical protein